MKDFNDFSDLENAIGYSFKDKELIKTALTHPSADGKVNYERLEFLGDAVLELSISELLFAAYPDVDEGELTKMRAGIVCSRSLSAKPSCLSISRWPVSALSLSR